MKKILIILFILFPFAGLSQPLVYFKAIVGTYRMDDIKDVQEKIMNDFQQWGIETKVNSSFPASIQGDIGMDFQGKNFTLGFFLNYASTKGRVSGEGAVSEQNLLRLMAGVKATRKVYKNFSAYAKIGFNYTQLDVNSSDGQTWSDKNSFMSNGASIEPGFNWKYNYNRFKLLVDLGYELNVNGVMMSRNSDYTYLATVKNELMGNGKANWTGVRFGIGVAFVIVDHKAWVDPNLKK